MPATKPAKAPVSEYAPLADELGALESEMAPHAAKLARIDLLRKTLRAACTAPPSEPWSIAGTRFVAILGPRANERVVDFKTLIKIIGVKAFALFGTCTLKTLEENVPASAIAQVVTLVPTGTRPLKCFEKAPA